MGGSLMLVLHTKVLESQNFPQTPHIQLMRVSTDPNRPMPLRRRDIFLSLDNSFPDGYLAYAVFDRGEKSHYPADIPLILLPLELEYLAHDDVLAFEPESGAVRILYRRNSPNNFFFVTERCNHYCLMCSQPPRDVDDAWLIDEMLAAIPLIHPDTRELGFTGGEPTLLGDRFLKVLRTAKNFLPRTGLHVLSNGRRFSDNEFVMAYANIQHPDIMVGIPLYSDVSTIHDYVVQADGAYDETLRGILNLKRLGQKVEIRIVIHKQTYERLPQLAEFIARNLTMVDHVALMGLEITGFTRANLPALWIDPWDYRNELERAVSILSGHRMNVSVYNHQLCVIDQRVWPHSKKSISDWKNEYMPECDGCFVRDKCGGFFSSAKLRYSKHITAISNTDVRTVAEQSNLEFPPAFQ
jgi:His-Xaa-Ser system radical SAM maturase HxsC